MKTSPRSLIASIAVGLGLLMPAVVQAQALEQLSAEWWQWALSVPTPDNPLLDPTGANCAVGQDGAVWFIPVGGSGTRTCSPPSDRALVFPTLSSINIDTPNVCGQGPESIPVGDLRAAAATYIDGVTNQTVQLDGQTVANLQRVQSPVFEVTLPEDNWFDPLCTSFGNVPAGTYSPAIADGYFVMLDALEPGEHALYVHAEVQGSVLDVTYDLTVQCVGDCDANGQVTISDLITAVGIALDPATLDRCRACDVNDDAVVSIDELIRAVNGALLGC